MDILTYAILKKKIEQGISVDLNNYYKKSETYSQQEVNNLIKTIPTFKIQVVDTLPETDISTSTIYLLKIPAPRKKSSNLFDEYIYVENK